MRWGGVRFHDLLGAARPDARAGALHFVSAEKPYDDYLDLRQVALADVMLAYEMDGKPLRREHGAPVRVVIPEMYGYKNVKWVERIEVVARPGTGYWEQRGYDRTPGSGSRTARRGGGGGGGGGLGAGRGAFGGPERPSPRRRATSSGSHSPSGCCTGSTRAPSSSCSAPGSSSTCPRSRRRSDGGR